MLDQGARSRACDININVLVYEHRTIATIARCHQAQPIPELLRETLLLVSGFQPLLRREYPDLQEVHAFLVRVVEFRMCDACAGRHALHLAGDDNGARADTVLVLQGALQYPRQNFHIAVTVLPKAAPGLNSILVDDTQWPIAHEFVVLVVAE